MATLPKFFIGSSKEALDAGLVEALRSELDKGLNSHGPAVEIVLWSDSPWANLESALGSLVENLADYSYAAFILSADDEAEIRSKRMGIPRDNVVFEFGLFLAYLGKERTFLIGPANVKKALLARDIKTSSPAATPPPTVELRILSDVGSIYRMGRYTVSTPGPAPRISFGVDEVVATVNEHESRTSGRTPGDAEVDLKRRMLAAEAKIASPNKCDSFYSGQFFSEFRDLALLKARASGRSVQDVAKDVLLHLDRIGDICDIGQLAEEQHHARGVRKVWVFSDDPLEFRSGPVVDDNHRKLRETILDNLQNKVEYTYFVGSRFTTDWIDSLVDRGHPDRAKILKHLKVVIVQDFAFFTYFTVHFEKNHRTPKVIYMSTVMKDRRDLLIQVSGDHATRVLMRIWALLGAEDSRLPHIRRHVLRL